MKIIEERFASIETSVQFLEKEIDNIESSRKVKIILNCNLKLEIKNNIK